MSSLPKIAEFPAIIKNFQLSPSHFFRLRKVKMDQRKLMDNANTITDMAKVIEVNRIDCTFYHFILMLSLHARFYIELVFENVKKRSSLVRTRTTCK